ncbi:MAG: ankyrin repeat domain-containing protein, partial [Gemmataceae bacterium]|nr:ankyrin repeat domain-containing protein [Gemmataceae bacterium]
NRNRVMSDALIQRIADGRTDLVFVALARGLPATAVDDQGVSLLQWCAYYGDVSAIRHLLGAGESLASLGPNYDLNGAAFHGHWRLCQFLIEQGSDVNFPLADTGETPLHAALCKSGLAKTDLVLQVLLAAAANPNRSTKPGVETGGFMRDCRTRGETPLHRAAAFGSPRAIRMLLEAGAQVDARDAHGDSPLGWASWHLRPARILHLLCFGPHRIHPQSVEMSEASEGQAGDEGLESHLLGRPH